MFFVSALNQDLGWCVDDDVELQGAFDVTPCEATSCGVVQMDNCPTFFDGAFGDDSIRTAVAAWFADQSAAEATYGHISTWGTSGVTDMSWLFCGDSHDHSGVGYCNTSAPAFNEDIGAWDTSGVTTMSGMFGSASAFDQDISAWNIENVRDMHWMFGHASSFNQDIGGWRVEQVTEM